MKGLLARLVDDAGLFPPEQLPMGEALARHWSDEMSESAEPRQEAARLGLLGPA